MTCILRSDAYPMQPDIAVVLFPIDVADGPAHHSAFQRTLQVDLRIHSHFQYKQSLVVVGPVHMVNKKATPPSALRD